MKRKLHTPEQIIAKLRGGEAALAAGKSVAEVAKQLGVSEHTWQPHTSLGNETPAEFAASCEPQRAPIDLG